MLKSLKSRFALWILMPTILLLSVDIAVIFQDAENTATSVQKRLLYGSAKIISEQITFNDGAYEISTPPAAFELLKSKYKDRVFYSVHSKEGKLIAGGDELAVFSGKTQIEEEDFYQGAIENEPVRVIVFAHALPNSSSGDYVITQVGQTLRGHHEFRDSLIFSTIRGHMLLITITVISLFVALRLTLKPLMEFGQLLSERKPGSLEKVNIKDAPSELEPVIAALNTYAEKLGQTLSAYEKFVSNTAHHLRTSFASITSQISFGKREVSLTEHTDLLDSIQKSVSDCTKLINQLLLLAAVEQPRADSTVETPTNLSEIITKVIEDIAPLAQQKHIELGVDEFDESLIVAARPHLLREVFSNLIDNAIQHMGGAGSVAISLCRANGQAHFTLTDTGVGVPTQLQSRIFDRFFRIDTTRQNSSGLGLAIVKEICDSLGASITACTPTAGSGLQIDIYFPLPPDTK